MSASYHMPGDTGRDSACDRSVACDRTNGIQAKHRDMPNGSAEHPPVAPGSACEDARHLLEDCRFWLS